MQKKITNPRLRQAAVEGLERRMLMSVTAAQLAGPINIAGNAWTYAITNSSGGALGSETLTSRGADTSYGVQPAIEVDLTYMNVSGGIASTGQNFYGFQSQGYVEYESKTTVPGAGTEDLVYSSPYHLIASTSNTVGSPVTTPTATSTDTYTPLTGTPTVVTQSTFNTVTLVSNTPDASIQTTTGTSYNCYQFNSTETDTLSGTTSQNTTQTYVSPVVGVVKLVDNLETLTLTSFTGTSYHLAVNTIANAAVDEKIGPVQVSLVDSAGNLDTTAADQVTITPTLSSTSTGTGTLSGATPVTTVGGVATFSGLTLSKAGSYSLNFTDSVGRTVPSNTFGISAGKLVIEPIRNGVAGTSLDEFAVKLETSKRKLITDAPSLVTLSVSTTTATNPTISNNVVQQTNGLALFNNLKLGVPGKYVLTASDDQGDTTSLSNSFEVTGVHLAFKKQPAKAGVGAPLHYLIEVENAKGNLVNISSIGLGFTLDTSAGSSDAVINSPADTIDFGKASDSANDVSISQPGTYTFTATVVSQSANAFDYTIDPITSKSFTIVGNRLEFAKGKQPASTNPGVALAYEVEMVDFHGKVVASNGDQLQFSLVPLDGATGALSVPSTDQLIGGTAINAAFRMSVSLAGKYKLLVTDIPAPGEPVAEAVTSAVFTIKTLK